MQSIQQKKKGATDVLVTQTASLSESFVVAQKSALDWKEKIAEKQVGWKERMYEKM